MKRQIIGAKGGSGSSFVTRPDTLRSTDSFEILFGLGSGRWKGLTEGLQSLKINGVPLENKDGSSNFEDVVALFGDGNPLEIQRVYFKLGGGGDVKSIGVPLSNDNSNAPGPWVVGAVDTPGADYIDLRFVVQQLFHQNEKSVGETSARIEIQMRPTNSEEWVNPFIAPQSNTVTYQSSFKASGLRGVAMYLARRMFNESGTGYAASNVPYLVIRGKTNSPYVKEFRIDVPNEGKYDSVGWEVRARLIEPDTIDNDDIQTRRTIAFESIATIIKQPLGDHPDWRGQVWLQIIGKASDQFNGFPEIESVCDTKICQTPPLTVWDPETRQYTGGTWDGSYEEHFTTDPAWQMKEFIEDPIHGVAGLQPGSTLDKWDALEASQYYSELVPNGRGGLHPRFNMNLNINQSQDVNEMLQYLAGSVNSYIEDVGNNTWRIKVDKPETPKVLFTSNNVFGEISYNHSDVDTRYNDWRGTFLNEEYDYEEDVVRVFDQDNIDENGTRFTEIALIGCTNRQEALRRLMFRLRVSLNEYKVASFTTNRVGRYISPLDTILIADEGLSADHLLKSSSRLHEAKGKTVVLKRPVRLEVGVSYKIHFTTKDGVVARTVTNGSSRRGDQHQIEIDEALPDTVLKDTSVSLEAEGLKTNPISYRVVSVERSAEDMDEYRISAVIIDSGKWDAMDNVSEQEIQSQERADKPGSPVAPSSGLFNVNSYPTPFGIRRTLTLNWLRPEGLNIEEYVVEYSYNEGPWKLLNDRLRDRTTELEDPQEGNYSFKVYAKNVKGILSDPLIASTEVLGGREFLDSRDTIGRTSRLSNTGRISDPTMYNTQALLGIRNSTNLNPQYSVNASNVTVTLPAHTRKIAGPNGPIEISYGAASGVVGFQETWYAYIDDPELQGSPTPAVSFTSNQDDLLYAGRYHISSGKTPDSSGGGGTITTGGGSTSGRDYEQF